MTSLSQTEMSASPIGISVLAFPIRAPTAWAAVNAAAMHEEKCVYCPAESYRAIPTDIFVTPQYSR